MATQTAASRLNASLSGLAALDEKQAGHLRHFHNLANQQNGDWSHMQGDDPDNVSDESGYRYQLAYMTYAMACAHRHRLPAAPGVFKADFDRAIQKMMRREVWAYWHGMSQSGPRYDPDLTEPRQAWWDPVVKENIMYSGHLTAMAALYGYLFNDDKYEQMGSIWFEPGALAPFDTGRAEYNLKSLNDAIYWQMVETGFVGVACQPNLIFAICNQFPIWGFRFEDIRTGDTRADEVTANHEAAWKRRGGYQPGQATPFMVRQRQDAVWDADWSGAYYLINSWNPEYFRSVYGLAKEVLLARDETGDLHPRPVGQSGKARRAIAGGAAAPRLNRNVEERPNGSAMMAGYTAVTLAEAGDPDLARLLAYADAHMSPKWENGGYYYPRNDGRWDADGKFVGVCPHSGNVTFGWGRLNVKDGLRQLYADVWTKAHFEAPSLAAVSEGVDLTRAVFDPARNRLALSAKPMHGTDSVTAELVLANVRRQCQAWKLSLGDELVASGGPGEMDAGAKVAAEWRDGALVVREQVTGPTDFVMDWA